MKKVDHILTSSLLITGSVLLSMTSAYATECASIDSIVANNLKKSLTNSSYHANNLSNLDEQADLQEQANITIDSVLKNYAKDKDSVHCPFTQAKAEGLQVLTSEDNKFQAYSWDTYTGGTMHHFTGFTEMIGKNGKTHITNLDSYALSLFTTKIKGKPLYMLVHYSVGDTMNRGQQIKLYQEKNNRVINPKLIKTRSGLTNQIEFSYNFFSLVDENRSSELFEFNRKTNTLRFPVVLPHDEYPYGKVTNKWIRYRFDGQYFRKVQ